MSKALGAVRAWTRSVGERYRRSAAGEFVARFGEHDLLSRAAALSFYSLLSLAPLVVILLWITASLYPPAQEEFFRQLYQLAGPEAENTARLVVRNAQAQPSLGSITGWISIGTLLFGASIVFAQLQTTLNHIFAAEGELLGGALAWLRKRLISFGIVFAISFLLIVSMAAQALLQLLLAGMPSLWPAAAAALSLVVFALAFAAIYRLLPDRPVNWRLSLAGGVATAVLLNAGQWAIGQYLGLSPLGSIYGPAGGVVIMLIWIYFSGATFYAGALLTSVLQNRLRASRPPRRTLPTAGNRPSSRAP